MSDCIMWSSILSIHNDVRVSKSELFSCKQERFLTFDPYIIIIKKQQIYSHPMQIRETGLSCFLIVK